MAKCKCDFCYCNNQVNKKGVVCNNCLSKIHMDENGQLVDEEGKHISNPLSTPDPERTS